MLHPKVLPCEYQIKLLGFFIVECIENSPYQLALLYEVQLTIVHVTINRHCNDAAENYLNLVIDDCPHML